MRARILLALDETGGPAGRRPGRHRLGEPTRAGPRGPLEGVQQLARLVGQGLAGDTDEAGDLLRRQGFQLPGQLVGVPVREPLFLPRPGAGRAPALAAFARSTQICSLTST
jgi:hypothetical protein